jgi:ribosome-binding factor A
MPVQNHPRYDEWSRALDRLKEANDCYRAAVIGKLEKNAIDSLRFNLDDAQREYNKIADEIGA